MKKREIIGSIYIDINPLYIYSQPIEKVPSFQNYEKYFNDFSYRTKNGNMYLPFWITHIHIILENNETLYKGIYPYDKLQKIIDKKQKFFEMYVNNELYLFYPILQ